MRHKSAYGSGNTRAHIRASTSGVHVVPLQQRIQVRHLRQARRLTAIEITYNPYVLYKTSECNADETRGETSVTFRGWEKLNVRLFERDGHAGLSAALSAGLRHHGAQGRPGRVAP